MMDVLMSETCWAHKKWNKIASDIKKLEMLVYIVLLWSYEHEIGTIEATLIIHVLELCMVWNYFLLYSISTPACE